MSIFLTISEHFHTFQLHNDLGNSPHSLQCPNKPQRYGLSLIPDPQAASLLETGEFPAQEGQAGGLGTEKLKHDLNSDQKKGLKHMDYKRKGEKMVIPYSVRGKSALRFGKEKDTDT